MNNSQRINKAKKKRFDLLCTNKEFREQFRWWHIQIIGNAPYIENPLPKYNGERDAVKAFKGYAADLIKIYAPRKKLSCGHIGRKEHCVKCADNAIVEFDKFKASWIGNKGYTEKGWSDKVAMHRDNSGHKAPSPEFIERYDQLNNTKFKGIEL